MLTANKQNHTEGCVHWWHGKHTVVSSRTSLSDLVHAEYSALTAVTAQSISFRISLLGKTVAVLQFTAEDVIFVWDHVLFSQMRP
jgi:hypothetical protein